MIFILHPSRHSCQLLTASHAATKPGYGEALQDYVKGL